MAKVKLFITDRDSHANERWLRQFAESLDGNATENPEMPGWIVEVDFERFFEAVESMPRFEVTSNKFVKGQFKFGPEADAFANYHIEFNSGYD